LRFQSRCKARRCVGAVLRFSSRRGNGFTQTKGRIGPQASIQRGAADCGMTPSSLRCAANDWRLEMHKPARRPPARRLRASGAFAACLLVVASTAQAKRPADDRSEAIARSISLLTTVLQTCRAADVAQIDRQLAILFRQGEESKQARAIERGLDAYERGFRREIAAQGAALWCERQADALRDLRARLERSDLTDSSSAKEAPPREAAADRAGSPEGLVVAPAPSDRLMPLLIDGRIVLAATPEPFRF